MRLRTASSLEHTDHNKPLSTCPRKPTVIFAAVLQERKLRAPTGVCRKGANSCWSARQKTGFRIGASRARSTLSRPPSFKQMMI